MVGRIAKTAHIPRHISPHSLTRRDQPTRWTPSSRCATRRSLRTGGCRHASLRPATTRAGRSATRSPRRWSRPSTCASCAMWRTASTIPVSQRAGGGWRTGLQHSVHQRPGDPGSCAAASSQQNGSAAVWPTSRRSRLVNLARGGPPRLLGNDSGSARSGMASRVLCSTIRTRPIP